MDFDLLLCILLSLISLLLGYTFLWQSHHQNLPPTPPFSLPFIGHFHLLKHPIHQTLQKLSQTYGHVISLRFGSRLAVIVSSPSAVQECFTKNDIVLANRPVLTIGKYLAYNNTTMSASPYGEHWRNLRRISTLEIFSTSRINSFVGIREEEVKRLMRKVYRGDSMEEFGVVELKPMLMDLTFNIVMRMVAGKKFHDEEGDDSKRFRDLVTEVMARAGSTNPVDFIPLWGWIDPSGFEKKLMNLGERADEVIQGLIDEIRNEKVEGNTMIHHLLRLQNTEPDCFGDQFIKVLISDIIIAGIDSSSVTIEWALSHLLNNPNILKRARDEIDSSIGHERLANEIDLSNLTYLSRVITETHRLTPAGPLLVPHCASQHCQIQGYDVPRDTLVLINVWAIHRDPNLWEDATRFDPQRHVDVSGVDSLYKLLPFGLGRRACPGMGMAQRVIGLTLASLIQCFEWKRVGNLLVDMTEGKGLTMPKAEPLVAKCRPRPIMKAMLSDATGHN